MKKKGILKTVESFLHMKLRETSLDENEYQATYEECFVKGVKFYVESDIIAWVTPDFVYVEHDEVTTWIFERE